MRQAADGEAALAAAAEQRPDIVLLDWMMPRLSGVEICRALRADMRLRDTPVIMLSAKGLDADIESGLEAGADDFIAKPFSPGLVLDRVRAVLAQAALLTRSPATPAALAPAIGSQVSLSFGDTVAGGVVRTGLPAYEITLHQAAPVPLPARSQLHYMGPPGVMCQHGALRGGDRGRALVFAPLCPPRLLLARRRLRADVRVPVSVRRADGTEVQTMSTELSECGVRLEGTRLAPIGEPIQLAVALDLFGAAIPARAEIARVTDGGFTVANFTRISQGSREQLSWRIFDHLLATRHATRTPG